ncbi:MAG: AAA family ATPase [Acidobacteriaceae bacterium]|nr:AAA family ATPase [Acidobacteriaceae bacterium]
MFFLFVLPYHHRRHRGRFDRGRAPWFFLFRTLTFSRGGPFQDLSGFCRRYSQRRRNALIMKSLVKQLVERERELAAVEALLEREGGLLMVEGGAGIGKTSLLEAACQRAQEVGCQILRARGSELEADFAFGVVRQLFERHLANTDAQEREALLAGPAAAVRPLLLGQLTGTPERDTLFALLHGFYWLSANLAGLRPLLLAVDDAHWGDEPSLRWLAYLATRLEGLALALIVALRPGEPNAMSGPLLALRTAATVVRPALLSESAVGMIIRDTVGDTATNELCAAVWTASGGNPLYLNELLRAIELEDRLRKNDRPSELLACGREEIARLVIARVRSSDPGALRLAQAIAILGDSCELRHAAAIAGVKMSDATRLAANLVRREVLASDHPPTFIHPVVRDAVETSMSSDEREAAHRSAARLLHADGAPAGQVAAHLLSVRPAGDIWMVTRLAEAARIALASGATQAAARLLERALAEPPPIEQRLSMLREAAQAEASTGYERASILLEQALRQAAGPHERAEIALEVAAVYATVFRYPDAMEVLEKALAELGGADPALAARIEGYLVFYALHDSRCASRVVPAIQRLCSDARAGFPAEALAVARGIAMCLAGRPSQEAAIHLEEALARAEARVEDWNVRAALLRSLVVAERFDKVTAALESMTTQAYRSGSARALIATFSTLGFLKLRLGALPEAESAARVALRVLQESDFRTGLPFTVAVLADVAIEAGEWDEAQALLALIPQEGWPAGVATVLIPAARGRLRLAQGRPAEALTDFQRCAAMFSVEVWGTEMRDVGYLHARAGAAQALIQLGEPNRALEAAQAELSDLRVHGTPRALGIALRVAGLAQRGKSGLELLAESVSMLANSPALLERAHSLVELGAALRRSGSRAAAREPLAEGLDLAARCGARPLAARAREELKATGARPRREWRTGLEALTPGELRVIRLAAEGHSNRDIAQQLYVTLKTIEGHLSRAYDKLGISSRSQLSPILESRR